MIEVMRVKDVLKLPSIDSRGNLHGGMWGGAYPDDPTDPIASVAETITRKDVDGTYYENLREAIVKNGINRVPIHVADASNIANSYGANLPEAWYNRPVMGNGHHRIRILEELGFPYVLTTTEKQDSGYYGEYTSRTTDKLFDPTRQEETVMPVLKNYGKFVVEVNNGTGEGWVIVTDPIPRAYARRLKVNFTQRHDPSKAPNFRARVVPTGDYKLEDALWISSVKSQPMKWAN
jgi:hypothetical protein